MKLRSLLIVLILSLWQSASALPGLSLQVFNAGFGVTAGSAPPATFGIAAGSGANVGKFVSTLTGSVIKPVLQNIWALEAPWGMATNGAGGLGNNDAGICAMTSAQLQTAVNQWDATLVSAGQPYGL